MSKLEVDAIEPQSGTTLTLGANGDTVNIASGATITDFKSTGIDDNATSTAITIDSSQNVGIGTTSPAELLNIVGSGGNAKIRLDGDLSGGLQNNFIGCLNYDDLTIASDESNTATASTIQFRVDATERMRIDSSGNVSVGKTTLSGNTEGINLTPTGSSNFVADEASTLLLNRLGNTGDILNFRQGSGNNVGSISVTASATAYNTSSDYRLKENVSYDFDATSRLKQLKPARFNFIADANTTVDGFLAHEVQDIVPEAIHGTKDAMRTEEYEVTPAVLDENGNVITEAVMGTREVPDYQGIDQSKLVPLLVKTIQELEARITTLENA